MQIRPRIFEKLLLSLLFMFASIFPADGMTGKMYEYEKMASSVLTKACQDKYGFVWTATEFGLSRFDGYHFVNYYHIGKDSTSISGNLITTLACTSDGAMFIGCSNGLMQYDYTSDNFYNFKFPHGIHPRVNSISETPQKKLWVSTAGHGVYLVDPDRRTVRHAPNIEKVTGNRYMTFLYTERRGYTWIFTSTGRLIRCRINHDTTPTAITEVQTNAILPIYITEEESGQLLVFLTKKILRFNPLTGQLMDAGFLLPDDLEMSSAYKAPDGTIYIGSKAQGLYTIKKGASVAQQETLLDRHYPLRGISVSSICLDKTNNLWMACPHHGLYFCSTIKQKFLSWNFTHNGERLCDGISSITPPSGDTGAFCVMQNKGLFKVDAFGNTTKCEGIPSDCNVIFRSKHGSYWLGTQHALYAFHPQTGTVSMVYSLEGKGTTSIAEDHKGQLYVSIFGDGFALFDQNGKLSRHYNTRKKPQRKGAKFGNDWVMQIYCDQQGLVWLATLSGIWCYDPEKDYFVDFGTGDGIMREKNVSAICEMPDHNLMVGTQSGLYLCNRTSGRVVPLPGGEALVDMSISSMERDNDGDIWISTLKGIWQYNSKARKLISFVGNQEIAEEEFVGRASCHDNDFIYFGSNSTVTLFSPNDLKGKAPSTGHVHITQFSSLSRKYNPLDSNYVIPWDDNHFTLEVSLLDSRNTDVSFEYRVNDGKWTRFENEGNALTFTKLDYGTYQLEIRASRGGICVSDTKRITIKVEAPWYASTAAQVVYCLAGLSILCLMALYFYRRQKANFEEEKMRLLINATHDIRSPLTLILGPIDKLKELVRKNCDAEAREVIDRYVNTIDRNVERLLILVNQILDIRKIDKRQMKIKCKETDMADFAKKSCLPFGFIAEQRGISLKVEAVGHGLIAWIDPIHFGKVMANILGNAFKYTLDGGEIIIRISQDDKTLTIEVTDSGIGLGNEKTSRFFERFYQGKACPDGTGTGIGLNLAMNIVKLHGGSIAAANRTDGQRGACITIQLPRGNSHLDAENIYVEPENKETSPKVIYKKGHIMVVDDDCELSAYVARELSPWYQVDRFSNGLDAMQALFSQEYDLVVSDVMMSGMDGISLLKKIKQNPNSNHIPVILLTSKSEVVDRLAGFKSGADAYLVKPFTIEELHARIDNLLDTMQRLKGKFTGSQQQLDKVKQVDVKGNDEQLMANIMKSVNGHLSDCDFTVEILASEVNMSVVQLHRKMKKMAGVPTGKFIRNIRMEQARRLIAGGKLNISQVAFEVGFNDPTYFSTVFKQYFGKSPSEYAEAAEK